MRLLGDMWLLIFLVQFVMAFTNIRQEILNFPLNNKGVQVYCILRIIRKTRRTDTGGKHYSYSCNNFVKKWCKQNKKNKYWDNYKKTRHSQTSSRVLGIYEILIIPTIWRRMKTNIKTEVCYQWGGPWVKRVMTLTGAARGE